MKFRAHNKMNFLGRVERKSRMPLHEDQGLAKGFHLRTTNEASPGFRQQERKVILMRALRLMASSGLFMLMSCSARVEVETLKPQRKTIEAIVTTINAGTVEAQQASSLNFATSGRVAQVLVQAGEQVKKGQLLAELDNGDFKAAYTQAKNERDRADSLISERLISQLAYEETKRAYEMAKASLERTQIRAPFAGMVAEMNLKVGEISLSASSGVGTTLKAALILIDNQPRIVKGEVDEIDLARVRTGQRARVRVPALGREKLEAEVTRVVPFISSTKEQERVSAVEIEIKDQTKLVPVGASGEIEIIVDEKKEALAVPTAAVLGSGKSKFVFVVGAGEKLEKREVEVGLSNFEFSEIKSGVSEQDAVVIPTTNQDLQPEQKVRGVPRAG